jgi:hypothetical protein
MRVWISLVDHTSGTASRIIASSSSRRLFTSVAECLTRSIGMTLISRRTATSIRSCKRADMDGTSDSGITKIGSVPVPSAIRETTVGLMTSVLPMPMPNSYRQARTTSLGARARIAGIYGKEDV